MLSTLRKTLPVHPLTGAVALGFTAKGRPVWPVRGGAEDDGGGDDDGKDGGKDDDGKDDDGDDTDARVKAARDQAAAQRLELKPWKALAKETGLTPDQIRDAIKRLPKDDEDKDAPDADAIRREAETAAAEKANARIVRAEVKALAADLFADPADAPLYLDLTKYDVDDDGEVSVDEIKSDLKKVLKDKPHLAKKGAALKPDRSQGQGGAGGARPTDLRELSRMSVVRKN